MTVQITKPSAAIAAQMAAAMQSDDPAVQEEAWGAFHESLSNQIMADFEEYSQSRDDEVLASRGYRQLTSKETKWYQSFIDALKSANPKQAFVEVVGADIEAGIMPETILEDVYKNLTEDHPLLKRVNFQYVKYATKWIINDHTKAHATWGKITAEITKEIESGFKVIDVNQSKLSAFAFIEKGMLDLGPVFLDAYIRAVLREALLCGLEKAIVGGTGVDCPIGADRDIHEGVSFSTTDGYPRKTAIKVTSFEPAEYGELLANIATTETGAMRKFTAVQIVCNMVDYLTKIMPATTMRDMNKGYINDVFPFPTEVVISNELDTGDALLGLLDEYNMFMGGEQNGVIEFSDEFKFTDDVRYFKTKQYGAGRAFDNTSFVLLDISGLEPLNWAVSVVGTVSTEDVTPSV